MKLSTRSAFTLVELLVVIAIIGILIGMMLPGIQASHEAARRAMCQSRMSHLGMALQNYQAANGVLPPGTTDPKGPIHSVPVGNHISWIVHLLPYLDEQGTFKHIDLAAGAYDPKNENVRTLRIPALICPTDRDALARKIAVSNFAGCHHDVEAPIDQDNHGVLFLNSKISARDITDGVANTIFLGEKLAPPSDLGWLSGTRATLRNTGTPLDKTDEATLTSELAVGGFDSYHPAGSSFLFGDGAVKFVSNEIEKDIYQQLAHRADGKLLLGGPTRGE